jgi:hypothetical protein
MTLDRYGHLLPGLGDSLAHALDSAYESAGEPRRTSSHSIPLRPDLDRSSVYAW